MVDDRDEPDAHEVWEAFFRDIRALRANAGNPSFRKIGKDALCSHDTAHRLIEQGVLVKQIPTVNIAVALGGGRREWEARWAAAKTAEQQLAERNPETAAEQRALPADPPVQQGPADRPSPDRPAAPNRIRRSLLAAPLAVLLAVIVGINLKDDGTEPAGDSRPLFSDACEGPINLGRQNDDCVREVQLLLKRSGGDLVVDDSFGPETLRRVIAFQVLAGITPNGVVGETTKKALYEGETKITSWPKKRVEKRIREVFTEAPGRAVSIARCQSNLDPLYVLSNNDGTRNWGVFQLYEVRVKQLGGTPRKALDPEWNIKAAHRMWSKHRDFRDWQCDKTFKD